MLNGFFGFLDLVNFLTNVRDILFLCWADCGLYFVFGILVFSYVSDIYGLVSGDNIYRFHFLKRGSGGSQSVLIFENGVKTTIRKKSRLHEVEASKIAIF